DERVARLVDIAELDGLADAERAAIRLFLTGNHPEQCGLAGPVRADDADDAAGRQTKIQLLDQQVVAEAFSHLVRLDDEIAEPRPRRQHDLRGFGRLLAALRNEGFISGDARLALGLPRARAGPNPFQFALQGAPARL